MQASFTYFLAKKNVVNCLTSTMNFLYLLDRVAVALDPELLLHTVVFSVFIHTTTLQDQLLYLMTMEISQ